MDRYLGENSALKKDQWVSEWVSLTAFFTEKTQKLSSHPQLNENA